MPHMQSVTKYWRFHFFYTHWLQSLLSIPMAIVLIQIPFISYCLVSHPTKANLHTTRKTSLDSPSDCLIVRLSQSPSDILL